MTTAERTTTTITARISKQLRSELDTLTKSTGRNKNALVEEALRRFVEVERWQLADIEAGLREADAGDFATDEEVDAVFNKYASYRDQPDAQGAR
jgi:RHH-type rel operon transcriptional repressor/antitoxin RelB